MILPRRRTAWIAALSLGGALLAGWALPAEGQSVQVESGLEPETAGLEEAVVFWIEVRTQGRRAVSFKPHFELDNFEHLGRPSRSDSFRFINGVSTRTLRYSWRLRPLEVGPGRVSGIRVTVGGQAIDLPSRQIEITAEPPAGRRRSPGSGRTDRFGRPIDPFDPFGRLESPFQRRQPVRQPKVFLRAEIHPRKPFAGQQTTYVLYIYTQADVSSVHPTRIPDFQGFWAHPVPQPESSQPEIVQVDGEGYSRVALLRRVLFPRREGTLDIEPAELDLLIHIAERGFFGPRLSRPEKVSRKSNRLRVEVGELPQGPESFSGAVGAFDLQTDLSVSELMVGEAATLTVTLAGDGHVQSLPAPVLPELPGLKILPPEESVRDEFRGHRVLGERIWRYVLVPERPGQWNLDPLQLPFYDPAVDAYRVATSDGFSLSAFAGSAEGGGELATGELNPIRSASVPFTSRRRGGSFLAWLFFVPVGLTLALRFGTREGRAKDPNRARLVEELSATAALRDHRRAAANMEKAWGAYFAARWDISEALPAAKWVGALENRLTRESAERVGLLVDDLHYLRHAPELSATDALRNELVKRSRDFARRLR